MDFAIRSVPPSNTLRMAAAVHDLWSLQLSSVFEHVPIRSCEGPLWGKVLAPDAIH